MHWNLITAFRNSTIAMLCLGSVGLLTGMPDRIPKQMEKLGLAETGIDVCGDVPVSGSMMMPDKDMLASLPPSAFNHTADGITAAEMSVLIHAGESANWKFTDSENGRLVIQSKHSSSSKVAVHAFAMGADAVLVVETQQMQNILVETWLYQVDEQAALHKELLPDVSVSEFYAEEDQDADLHKHSANVIMWVGDKGAINYSIRYWMEAGLADKKLSYGVSAVWDGGAFRLIKTKL